MLTSMLFSGLSSLAKIASADFKPLLTFLIALRPWMAALSCYNESGFSKSANWLLLVGMILVLSELVFLNLSFGWPVA